MSKRDTFFVLKGRVKRDIFQDFEQNCEVWANSPKLLGDVLDSHVYIPFTCLYSIHMFIFHFEQYIVDFFSRLGWVYWVCHLGQR